MSSSPPPTQCHRFASARKGRGGEEKRGEKRGGEGRRGEKRYIQKREWEGRTRTTGVYIRMYFTCYTCVHAVHLQSADRVPEVLTSSSYSTLMAATALATPSFSPATVMSALSTDGGGMLIRVPVWSERALAWPLMKGWNFFSTSRRSKASLACACVCVCVCVCVQV